MEKIHALIDFRESDPAGIGGFRRDSAVWAVSTALEQFTIAVFGHPARSGKVTIIDAPAALGVRLGIEAEEDLDHLTPVGAFLGGIKEAEVKNHMGKVVVGQRIAVRRRIKKGRLALCHMNTGSQKRPPSYRYRLYKLLVPRQDSSLR